MSSVSCVFFFLGGGTISFHCIENSSMKILWSISFYVPQKKVILVWNTWEYIFIFCDGNETEHFNSETGVLLNHNLCISEQWAQCVFSIRHLVTLQQRQPALWALNISRIYCVFTIRVTIKHKHTRLLYNSLVKHSEQVVLQYSKNMTLWWVCNKRV